MFRVRLTDGEQLLTSVQLSNHAEVEMQRRVGDTVPPDWIMTVFPTVLRRTGPEDLLRGPP